jgi:hypothetical protein
MSPARSSERGKGPTRRGINRGDGLLSGSNGNEFASPILGQSMTTRTERSLRPSRWLTWAIPLLLAFNVPLAHAQWQIAIADAPAAVIRGTDLYSASVNQRLATDDMIEFGASGILLLQDDAGNVMALGPDTRILLEANARISLLRGWVKIAHQCAVPPCAGPVVETERGTLEIGDHAAAIVAAIPAPDVVSEAFSESGTQKLVIPANGTSTPDSVALAEGQFATIASNAPANLKPRPSPAFLAGMPIAFRDALMRVPASGKLHDTLPAPLRPVSFDDVAPWLMSALPARNQPATRFVDRFRPRLADAAFAQHVEQNSSALFEWQAVEPASKPAPDIRVAQKSTITKAGPGVAAKGAASAAVPIAASSGSANWLTRLFSGLHK